ncbi:SPOR domain-containing protein [Dethiosulfatarculus sandiegensis]|uniref:SPOR domain-containing protein n=1 Tax=Dethiosulfatarculus sandiegensis TaxID=1429043 RepID=A0A0D2JZY4_9BACT|nr:SPOR domain-containing protein [Dethiosulfatarculus sandiegensis]KIX15060.1 hypothetical protein X474_06020 [Dethiosulfatarculus sandiegensis]
MLTLIILGLFTCGTLFLLAALIFLYRWISRKRLFPQLPRLWARERMRFVISSGMFLACLAAFALVGTLPPESLIPSPAPNAKAPLGPSFDGKPPPSPSPAVQTGSDEPKKAAYQGETVSAQDRAQEKPIAGTMEPPPPAGQVKAQPATAQLPADQGAINLAAPGTPKQEVPARPPEVQARPSTPPAKAALEPAEKEPQTAQPKISGQGWTTEPEAEASRAEPAQPPRTEAQAEPETKPAPKPSPAPQKEKAKPQKAQPTTKAYSVCAASYRKIEAARKDAAKLTAKGLSVTVVAVDLPGKGHWNRVCAGTFPDPRTAQAQAAKWKKQGLIPDPFVVRLR